MNEKDLYKSLGLSIQQCEVLGVKPLSIEKDGFRVKVNPGGEMYKTMLEYTSGMNIIFDEINSLDSNIEQRINEEEKNIPKLIDNLLMTAILLNGTDLHFEIYEDIFRVRIRIDGKLEVLKEIDFGMYQQVATKIKIMADMDISEKRIPQDGRFTFHHDNRDIDIRVSTSPTIWGEKLVLRILNGSGNILTIEDLGLSFEQKVFMEKLTQQSGGLVLFSGPTNSGKTTSIFALLQLLNKEDVNIITIEDPVEYRVYGLNQIQINKKSGLDFAQGLRTVLRQDPDILMVGEIRNKETATIALRAALTGVLVFSTIHSENSISTIFRLLDMGMEPYLIAESILAIVSQRLVNCLCPYCKEEEVVVDPYFFNEPKNIYTERGCSKCNKGNKGRKGVFEILPFDSQIRRQIYNRASIDKIQQLCEVKQISTLKKEFSKGLLKGEYSLKEVQKKINTLQGIL